MRDVCTPCRMNSARDTTLDLALCAHVSPAEVQGVSPRKALGALCEKLALTSQTPGRKPALGGGDSCHCTPLSELTCPTKASMTCLT